MSRRRWLVAIIASVALILIFTIAILAARPENVEVVRPQRRTVVELVVASGSLRALGQSDVGSEVPGVVRSVFVREGDQVTAGQQIVTLDRTTQVQRVEQARLATETARRELDRVRSGATREHIARARAELTQARRVNTARLEEARQRLRRLELGGRPEEIRRAEAALRQARASRQQAETDLRRAEQLFERGAIPRADLDRATTQLELARAEERSAEQVLALARQPATPEEIAAARAEVRAAEATLEESVRIAQQNLNELLNQPRPEDLNVARARVREAESALRQAEVELSRRTIRAPFTGLVVSRMVEPGQSVNPGQTLVVVADMSRTEVVVETDEINLPRLHEGQPAILIAPAFPDTPFRGVVTRVGPDVDPQRGIVNVRIRPRSLPAFARPDITIDANIEVRRIPNALSLPVTSVIQEGDRSYVYAIEGGRAVRTEVRVLARGERDVAVEGISERTPVIVRASQVTAGERVRAVGG